MLSLRCWRSGVRTWNKIGGRWGRWQARPKHRWWLFIGFRISHPIGKTLLLGFGICPWVMNFGWLQRWLVCVGIWVFLSDIVLIRSKCFWWFIWENVASWLGHWSIHQRRSILEPGVLPHDLLGFGRIVVWLAGNWSIRVNRVRVRWLHLWSGWSYITSLLIVGRLRGWQIPWWSFLDFWWRIGWRWLSQRWVRCYDWWLPCLLWGLLYRLGLKLGLLNWLHRCNIWRIIVRFWQLWLWLQYLRLLRIF